VSGYVPKAWTLHLYAPWLMHLPGLLELLLRQTASASAALAVLNAAPVRLLDGCALARTLP
jgi:hypothetical protein